MAIGDRVRERREALGMTQPQLAQAVKARGGSLSQGQISNLEAGAVARPRALPELALALRTTVQWLLTGEETAPARQSAGNENVTVHRANTGPIVTAPEPLVVFRTVPNLGRAGETLVYRAQAGTATRPAELAFSKDAFAMRVVDDEASPRYERRDMLLIDPSTTPAEGDDCLFVRDPSADPFSGIPRRLVRITPEHWHVRRFQKDAATQRLDRSEWRAAWHIFGSYNRP